LSLLDDGIVVDRAWPIPRARLQQAQESRRPDSRRFERDGHLTEEFGAFVAVQLAPGGI